MECDLSPYFNGWRIKGPEKFLSSINQIKIYLLYSAFTEYSALKFVYFFLPTTSDALAMLRLQSWKCSFVIRPTKTLSRYKNWKILNVSWDAFPELSFLLPLFNVKHNTSLKKIHSKYPSGFTHNVSDISLTPSALLWAQFTLRTLFTHSIHTKYLDVVWAPKVKLKCDSVWSKEIILRFYIYFIV